MTSGFHPPPKKTYKHFSSPHTFHIPSQSHLPCFDHPKKIRRVVKVMKMLVMLFSPSSSSCHPISPNTFLSTQFLKHPLSMYISCTAIHPVYIYFKLLCYTYRCLYITNKTIYCTQLHRSGTNKQDSHKKYTNTTYLLSSSLWNNIESFTYELHTAEF